MPRRILTDVAAGITELKQNPMKVIESANGDAIAILNRNEPAFYCIPAKTFENMIDRIAELETPTTEKRANCYAKT